MIGKRPTLSPKPTPLSFHKPTPLTQSSMHSGCHKPKPTGNRPSPPPPQGKSGWQDKMKKFMDNKKLAGLNTILDSITALFEENERLKQQLRDYRKEDEIAKLEAEIAQMRLDTLHTLTSKEKAKASNFRKKHYESCKGNTQYILLGTGIGTATTVQCTKCGEKENITDYEGW